MSTGCFLDFGWQKRRKAADPVDIQLDFLEREDRWKAGEEFLLTPLWQVGHRVNRL
jgi:hypothetical protein